MVKRILALHGVGSSSETLKAQMSALEAELGPDYDFTYLDGAIERERGPGMLPNSRGPFYSYTTGYSPAEIRDALDDIDDFVEDYGPFDGIVAFSQGGGFAASYILDHQQRSADGRPPFSFAIFLSPAAAFSADETCNLAVIEELLRSDYEAANKFADMKIPQLSPKGRLLADYMATTFGLAKSLNVSCREEEPYGRLAKDR